MAVRSALTDTHTPANVQPVGGTGFGDPVFSDEFTETSLNSTKWIPWYPDTDFWNSTVPGGHKTNSNEPQGYDESGISFVDGKLRLTFREGNDAVPELAYTSGMICSYQSFTQAYGYFEARIKVPQANGSWPAFWMMPADMVWPPEIDIMENWGKASWNVTISHGVITSEGNNSSEYNMGTDVWADFHTYGCLWEPGKIRWYVDGVLAKTTENSLIPSNPFYIICNLAGDKGSEATVATTAPFHMDVDYIRAWQLGGAYVDEPNTPDVSTGQVYGMLDGSVVPLQPYTKSGDDVVMLYLNA